MQACKLPDYHMNHPPLRMQFKGAVYLSDDNDATGQTQTCPEMFQALSAALCFMQLLK
jgi:hypothetical protein